MSGLLQRRISRGWLYVRVAFRMDQLSKMGDRLVAEVLNDTMIASRDSSEFKIPLPTLIEDARKKSFVMCLANTSNGL